MTLEDTLTLMNLCDRLKFPSREDALHFLFFVPRNGYSWQDGTMVEADMDTSGLRRHVRERFAQGEKAQWSQTVFSGPVACDGLYLRELPPDVKPDWAAGYAEAIRFLEIPKRHFDPVPGIPLRLVEKSEATTDFRVFCMTRVPFRGYPYVTRNRVRLWTCYLGPSHEHIGRVYGQHIRPKRIYFPEIGFHVLRRYAVCQPRPIEWYLWHEGRCVLYRPAGGRITEGSDETTAFAGRYVLERAV